MGKIREHLLNPKSWLLALLIIYLIYNILSYTIGYWEPVTPLSDLPNKIAYVQWNYGDMAEGNPRSDLMIRNISGSNEINATANILPGERVGFSKIRWLPNG